MRGSQLFRWSGPALLLMLAACGSNSNEPASSDVTQTPAATSASASATPGPATQVAMQGDPPTSPATARLDWLMSQAKLPERTAIVSRTDTTNEGSAEGNADILQRFKDVGREIGAEYVLTVEGVPRRIQLGINQYNGPEGARTDFERGRPKATGPAAIDVSGVGEASGGAKVSVGSGPAAGSVNQIVFLRGRYVVSMADFVNDPKASPDVAIAVARAVDEQLKAHPNP